MQRPRTIPTGPPRRSKAKLERGTEGPRSAQSVSILIRALSWRSQTTDSLTVSLQIRPPTPPTPPTDRGTGRPCLLLARKSSLVPPITWPSSLPQDHPGCWGEGGGRKEVGWMGWGRLEKPSCVGLGIWGPAPATALPSCVALGSSLNFPGPLF